MNRWINRSIVLLGVCASAGCATTGPYLDNDTDLEVRLANSERHTFSYVRVFERDEQAQLYGKVEHRHGRCAQEGHVDLAIADAQGKIERTESVRMRSMNSRRHGSAGAAFRFRLAPVPRAVSPFTRVSRPGVRG